MWKSACFDVITQATQEIVAAAGNNSGAYEVEFLMCDLGFILALNTKNCDFFRVNVLNKYVR